jgi:hypothetical protein
LPGTVNAHEAIEKGRSLFNRRGVKPVSELKHLLVSGHSNMKIGRDVRKGKLFRGYWLYTLSLEERATCPRTCHHWETCYGNNMPFAKRIDHRDRLALQEALAAEIKKHLSVRERAGILIRLHALGDFFCPEYVDFWLDQLAQHPRLAIFGYTARKPDSEIGTSIQAGKRYYGRRFAIRWSDGGKREDCTVSVKLAGQAPVNSFICPEQTGKTQCCATCGLCWNSTRNVTFVEH